MNPQWTYEDARILRGVFIKLEMEYVRNYPVMDVSSTEKAALSASSLSGYQKGLELIRSLAGYEPTESAHSGFIDMANPAVIEAEPKKNRG